MCVNCTPKSHFAFVCLFRSETPAGSSLSQLIIQILRRGLWKAAHLAALPLTEIIPAEMMFGCSSHMLRKQQRQGGSRWLAVFICHRLLNSLVLHHSDLCSGFWPGYFYCGCLCKILFCYILNIWGFATIPSTMFATDCVEYFPFTLPGWRAWRTAALLV